MDLRVHASRDGVGDVTGASDAAKRTASLPAGAVFLANVDDDAGRCPQPRGHLVPEQRLAACHDHADHVPTHFFTQPDTGEGDARDRIGTMTTLLLNGNGGPGSRATT